MTEELEAVESEMVTLCIEGCRFGIRIGGLCSRCVRVNVTTNSITRLPVVGISGRDAFRDVLEAWKYCSVKI